MARFSVGDIEAGDKIEVQCDEEGSVESRSEFILNLVTEELSELE